MKSAVYITGTDTGIGKTWVTAALLRALRSQGVDAVGMKPVASGCIETDAGWRNDDALELLAASGLPPSAYPLVNPYALPLPASPHLAAREAGVTLSLPHIADAFARLQQQHRTVLVEGVGGWSVPFGVSPWWYQADLVKALNLPVVLVVGLRLGCINHALLSARTILADGCMLSGWIANRVDPDWPDHEAITADLAALLPVPLLGRVGHGQAADAALRSGFASQLGLGRIDPVTTPAPSH